MAKKTKDMEICDYCGKGKAEVRKLIRNHGEDSFICDECIEVCHTIIKAEFNKQSEFKVNINIQPPKELYGYLNNYVIGQEEAKKYLCSAVYNHYKKLKHNLEHKDDDEVE